MTTHPLSNTFMNKELIWLAEGHEYPLLGWWGEAVSDEMMRWNRWCRREDSESFRKKIISNKFTI